MGTFVQALTNNFVYRGIGDLGPAKPGMSAPQGKLSCLKAAFRPYREDLGDGLEANQPPNAKDLSRATNAIFWGVAGTVLAALFLSPVRDATMKLAVATANVNVQGPLRYPSMALQAAGFLAENVALPAMGTLSGKIALAVSAVGLTGFAAIPGVAVHVKARQQA